MIAFLLILGVPVLGVLLYVAEHYRRNAMTPGGRFFARGCVLAFGVGLGALSLILLGYVAIWVITGALDTSFLAAAFTLLAQVTASLLMLWTAWCAIRVFRLPTRPDDLASEMRTESASEELRLSSAVIALIPILLLFLGMFSVFIGVVVLLWGIAYRTSRRSRESQFLWTLALAVKQELPLAEEIDAFAEPLRSRKKRAYHSLSSRLRDGRSLGEALEMTTGVLPRPLTAELRTAEEAGTLPAVLTEAAARHTASLSRSRVDGSFAVMLAYGWVLLTIEASIVGFVMYWIIPKYKDIFNDFGVELPDLTKSAVAVADLFVEYFYLIMSIVELPILAALAGAIVYFVGWGNLNLPLLMRWFPRRDAPSLLRALSHAVGAGQPLAEMVEDMSHRHLRSDMRQRLARIGRALELGQPLQMPLCDEGFITTKEADALAAAQRAGNLPWALRTLADSMERTSRHRTQFWLEIAKPAFIVSFSLVVGWFVLAMFLPLVKLITDLT